MIRVNDITIYTECPECKDYKVFTLTEEQFLDWQKNVNIQDVLPHLSADDRERLISGYCPSCFDTLFSDE